MGTPVYLASLAVLFFAWAETGHSEEQTTGASQQALQAVRSIDQNRLAEIQSAYSSSKYSTVLELSASFEQEFPTSPRIPEVLNLRGLALLITRDASGAASAFQKALARAPDALLGDRNWKNYVRYNYSAALLESGKSQEAISELQSIDPESLDLPTRLKFLQLKSRGFERQEKFLEALSCWITIDRNRDEFGVSEENIQTHVDRILSKISSADQLTGYEAQAEGASFKDRIVFRSIQLLIAQGKSPDAREQLRLFLKNHPSSRKWVEAGDLLREMRQEVSDGNISIGLLIPQKGKFAGVGQKALQATALALGIFGNSRDSEVQLIIEDSGESPETAVRALEKLSSEHKVAAVLGPILSKGADIVVQRAEELSIPLISLAQQSGKLGDFSFQAAISPAMQTRELVRHAIQKMGLKKFAILAPKDKFGTEYSQHFWTAVEELGGKITAYETYDSGETDFRKSIDRLAGLFYTEARKRELVALSEEREKDQIKKRNRKTERYFSLPPVIDFEAVFIPDEPKAASLAIPTFAYRDVDGVKILGLSAWNSTDFLNRLQKSAEGIVFMDAFSSLAPIPRSKEFTQRYQSAFAQDPGSIEAIVFDAATVLSKIVATEATNFRVNRMRITDRLREIRDLEVVTGKISVQSGTWTRELRALTFRGAEVSDWAPEAKPPLPSR